MAEPPHQPDDVLAALDLTGDDRARLRVLSSAIVDAQAHVDRLRAERIRVAARMREDGAAMIDIARYAGVTDSYLSRRLLASGATPRHPRSDRW